MSDQTCEFPDSNPTTEEIEGILTKYRTIAVVGLSPDPSRDSHRVSSYLKENGYRIIPVNPREESILGERSYPSLRDIPDPVDVVDIFRKVDYIPGIVDQAIEIGAKAVWMQQGLAHNESAQRARKAGLEVVQSKCIMQEHKKLFGSGRVTPEFKL